MPGSRENSAMPSAKAWWIAATTRRRANMPASLTSFLGRQRGKNRSTLKPRSRLRLTITKNKKSRVKRRQQTRKSSERKLRIVLRSRSSALRNVLRGKSRLRSSTASSNKRGPCWWRRLPKPIPKRLPARSNPNENQAERQPLPSGVRDRLKVPALSKPSRLNWQNSPSSRQSHRQNLSVFAGQLTPG